MMDDQAQLASELRAHAKEGRDQFGDNATFDLLTRAADALEAQYIAPGGLETISGILQYWIDFDRQARDSVGMITTDDTFIMSPPSWPTHGVLKHWIKALDAAGSPIKHTGGNG